MNFRAPKIMHKMIYGVDKNNVDNRFVYDWLKKQGFWLKMMSNL